MAVSEGSEAGLKRCSRCRCSLSKITVALSCLECLKCRPEDVAVMCGSRCFAMHFKLEHNPARRNRCVADLRHPLPAAFGHPACVVLVAAVYVVWPV